MAFSQQDERFMRQALDLARLGTALASPGARVGAGKERQFCAEGTDMKGELMERKRQRVTGFVFVMVLTVLTPAAQGQESRAEKSTSVKEALEWNQIFVETLIATDTATS